MVQRAALAVSPDPGEIEDPPLTRGEQLLAGELRGGAQIEPVRLAVGLAAWAGQVSGESVKMGLVAWRHLKAGGFDLSEAPCLEPGAHGAGEGVPCGQEGAAAGVNFGAPPGRSTGHRCLVRVGAPRIKPFIACAGRSVRPPRLRENAKGRRQFASEGLRARYRRQALRRAQR